MGDAILVIAVVVEPSNVAVVIDPSFDARIAYLAIFYGERILHTDPRRLGLPEDFDLIGRAAD